MSAIGWIWLDASKYSGKCRINIGPCRRGFPEDELSSSKMYAYLEVDRWQRSGEDDLGQRMF
jgi:hypothetical protein